MKVRMVSFNKLSFKGEGSFGEYYHIRKTRSGVKQLNSCSESYPTIAKLQKSSDWSMTKKEFEQLVRLSKKTKLVPRPRGMAVIKHKHGKKTFYSCGYSMEHIPGKAVAYSYPLSHRDENLLSKARAQLKKDGVYWGDDHNGNVMLARRKKRRFIFVDAAGLHLKGQSGYYSGL